MSAVECAPRATPVSGPAAAHAEHPIGQSVVVHPFSQPADPRLVAKPETHRRIMLLSTSPRENQQIALALISRLEALHQAVVHDLHGNPEVSHQLITRWSVDADRLMHARNMLGNVDLG